MPIIRILALPQPAHVDVAAILQDTCVALAATMNTSPDQVWGTWETLPTGHYVQGDVAAQMQPNASHPPIVEVMLLEGRPAELKERILTCVGESLPAALGLATGNVYVRLVEMSKDQVFTGRGIVSKS